MIMDGVSQMGFNNPTGGTLAISRRETLRQKRLFALLHQAIQSMPAEKRELLLLSRIQKLKYSQIAERLRCDVGTVKVRVFRATREVEQKMGKLLREQRRCCSVVAG